MHSVVLGDFPVKTFPDMQGNVTSRVDKNFQMFGSGLNIFRTIIIKVLKNENLGEIDSETDGDA